MEQDKEEYVVRTILRSRYRHVIEEVIQRRSRIESFGNLVFTRALLEQHSKGPLTERMISQAFIGACMRSVCVRKQQTVPQEVACKGEECRAALALAQRHVTSKMTSFDTDAGFTATFNQAARQYVTSLTNHIFLNFLKWQKKLVRTELQPLKLSKAMFAFVVKFVQAEVNDGKIPNPLMFKSEEVQLQANTVVESGPVQNIVTRLKSHFFANEIENKYPNSWDGVACEWNIKKQPHVFLSIGLSYLRRLEELGATKLPCIVPQLKMKVRSITFGKDQIGELAAYIIRKNPFDHGLLWFTPENKRSWSAVTLKANFNLLFCQIFKVPKRLLSKVRACVTTDGISANWHLERKNTVGRPCKKRKTTETIEKLRQRTPGSVVVAIDPGHANILSACRDYAGKVKGTNKRALARQRKYDAMNISTFELKNTTWRSMTGMTRHKRHWLTLKRRANLQIVYDALAEASSKTAHLTKYDEHLIARINTSVSFQNVMTWKSPRRWRFEQYQAEQRAVEKLSLALRGDMPSTVPITLAWGDGSFGPTSKGHNSAPNKKLRKQLSRYFKIHLINEYNTSKKTSCCETDNVLGLKTKRYRRRTTVLRCNSCMTLLSRDANAAFNILKVFKHQEAHGINAVPQYLARQVRSNTLLSDAA